MHTRSIASHEAELSNKSISIALFSSLAVASTLLILKVFVSVLTGSLALKAGAVDSFVDTVLAIINIIVLKITNKESDKHFPMGYDKIIALSTIIHNILVIILTFDIFKSCIENLQSPKEITHAYEGIVILAISIILNMALVLYQKKVVKETKSLLIEGDMIHFQADLFTSISMFAGFIAMWYLNISWLDPMLALLACFYLAYAIYPVAKTSISSILDINDIHCCNEIYNTLVNHQIDIKKEDVFVIFTGKKHRLFIKSYETTNIQIIKEAIAKNHSEYECFIVS